MLRMGDETEGAEAMVVRNEASNIELDAMDRKILKALQADGRLTNRALAALISLSPSGTLSRVRRLEQGGIIKGYRAVVDPALGRRRLTIWANVTLASHTQGHLRKFEQMLHRTPEVIHAWKVAGQTDYHIRLMVAAPGDWNEIAERWREAGMDLRTVETQVELVTVKDGADWSMPDL
jgi:Lrp/AsnC family transcriptional regulator, leucine-responsive regulatory protein